MKNVPHLEHTGFDEDVLICRAQGRELRDSAREARDAGDVRREVREVHVTQLVRAADSAHLQYIHQH